MSQSEIAAEFGISQPGLAKIAKRYEWPDRAGVAAKTRARVEEKLALQAADQRRETTLAVNERALTLDEAIEQAADVGAAIVFEHRANIKRGRGIVKQLLGELEQENDSIEDIRGEIERETADDSSPHRRTAMLKAVSLPTRADVVTKLAAGLKTLIGLERQALGLDEEAGASSGLEAAIKELEGEEA